MRLCGGLLGIAGTQFAIGDLPADTTPREN